MALDLDVEVGDITAMVSIYTEQDLPGLRAAGRAAADTLAAVGAFLKPGLSTADIDAFVREDTARRGGVPSQLGYHGFTGACCTSRNDVVCHGVPSPRERLQDGDIINVDVTTELDGFHGDTSATFLIGAVQPHHRRLVDGARAARDAGIAAVRAGVRVGDVAAAIMECAAARGLSVVADYGGHGIGRHMHESPHIPHVGRRGRGFRLEAGMVITIEPMLCAGRPDVETGDDGWRVTTVDGRWSAQWEHTLMVLPNGSEIFTRPSAR